MASYTSYINTGKQNLNTGHDYTLQQIIAALGGLQNPTQDNYVQAEYRDITDPQLRSIADYLQQLGADGYQYQYGDILNTLNNATNAAYDARYNALDDAAAQFNRDMATQQESVADTIRGQYAQAIQSGVSRGMQNANILSSILGTTQAAAQSAQQLAEDRYQTGMDKQAQIAKDAADALTRSNAAYETLMGNIRQLYNDEIQEKTADLEYNASIAETNANYLASLYNADTNYAQGVLGQAAGVYNSNQSALANIIAAAANASAQDTYSDTYLKAALEAAAATKYSADQNAAATKYAAEQNAAAQTAYYAYLKAQEEASNPPTSTTSPTSTTGTVTPPYADPASSLTSGLGVNWTSSWNRLGVPAPNSSKNSSTKPNTGSNGAVARHSYLTVQ